jgi:hypothetical protein
MIVVCDDKLSELRSEAESLATGHVVAPVKDEINTMLSNKTYEQLNILQSQIQSKLASNEPLEVEYWEQLLKALTVWKAKVGYDSSLLFSIKNLAN